MQSCLKEKPNTMVLNQNNLCTVTTTTKNTDFHIVTINVCVLTRKYTVHMGFFPLCISSADLFCVGRETIPRNGLMARYGSAHCPTVYAKLNGSCTVKKCSKL